MNTGMITQSSKRGGDVLGELLHSISQPLTGLRCSLELAIDEAGQESRDGVLLALQQADNAIGLMQLMREYVEAERPAPEGVCTVLGPVVESVMNDLASIAEVHGVRLRLLGACGARLPMEENRLRSALQYLITAAIETQPSGGTVTIWLSESAAGAVLRVETEREARNWELQRGRGKLQSESAEREQMPLLRRARLAVAGRVFASAGCLPVFNKLKLAGFVRPEATRLRGNDGRGNEPVFKRWLRHRSK